MSKEMLSRNLCGFRQLVTHCKKITSKEIHVPYTSRGILRTPSRLSGTVAHHEFSGRLSKQQAEELALKLNSDERALLLSVLQDFQSNLDKDEYLGQLAASRWRSKFGRPSKLATLGDVDSTGKYCAVPDEWLEKKYAESANPPSNKELRGVVTTNAIPFIGFGFLDNFIMIIAGDYIDLYFGSYLCISTMAAAGLGNTLSDVMGIGSAYYLERFASYVGHQPPKLTPIQLDMYISRSFANLGRVIGVILGCLLGMFPLMFLPSDEEKEKTKKSNKLTSNVGSSKP